MYLRAIIQRCEKLARKCSKQAHQSEISAILTTETRRQGKTAEELCATKLYIDIFGMAKNTAETIFQSKKPPSAFCGKDCWNESSSTRSTTTIIIGRLTETLLLLFEKVFNDEELD